MKLDEVKVRHEYWWNHLLNNVQRPAGFNDVMPSFKLEPSTKNWAGWANEHRCVYNLMYVTTTGDEFDDTICHEVCHVFARRMQRFFKMKRKTGWHDAFWAYCFNVICSVPRGQYHDYVRTNKDIENARTLKKLMRLQEQARALQTGKGGR